MTGPAVVILTDPARCELGDTDVLVQAVLQVQRLSEAGLAPSQAFCDHPAAAMKFIEAYAKAFPELQLRSSDLPAPEALYSIVADGRVMPLQASAAPEAARTGDAGQPSPLYVLSLGAPDALVRALQHNRFVKSDIQVVEIAPVDDSRTESVSVAEAVAHEPLTRSVWRDAAAAEPDHDEEESFAPEGLASSDRLKLASVEVNLDHIQVDRGEDHKDPYDPVMGQPEMVPVVKAPAAAPVLDAGGGPASSAGGVNGGSITASDSGARPAPDAATHSTATSATTPEPDSLSPSPPAITAPVPVAGEEQNPEAAAGVDVSQDSAAVDEDATSPDSLEHTETPAGDHEEDGGEETSGGDVREDPAAATDGAVLNPPAAGTTESGEEPPRISATSFDAPGEDVRYPPTGSFAMDDDVSYSAPAGSGPGFDILEDLFGSGECEIIDLKAVLAGLPDAAGAPGAPVPNVGTGPVRGFDESPAPQVVAPPDSDGPSPDPEDAEPQRSPAVHDLDI
jgi:hypothetical protein